MSKVSVDSLFPVIDVPFVRSPYNYDTMLASDDSGLLCLDPSLAQQNYKESCDINLIVNTFLRTGEMPQATSQPSYGDFSNAGSYHECLTRVRDAQDDFNSLNGHIRARFGNDPAQLLDFLADANNRDEAVKLGLVLPLEAARATQTAVAATDGKISKKSSVPASNEAQGDEGDE